MMFSREVGTSTIYAARIGVSSFKALSSVKKPDRKISETQLVLRVQRKI